MNRTTNKATTALVVNIKAVKPTEVSLVQRQLYIRFWAKLIAHLPKNVRASFATAEDERCLEPPRNNNSDLKQLKDRKKPTSDLGD